MSDQHKCGKPTYAAEPRELSEGRKEEGTRARPKQGQRLEPKVKNKTLYLACSCLGFQASVSTAWKKSLSLWPQHSTTPKICHKEMEPVIKGCQEWGRRGSPGVNNRENGCFLLCRPGLRSLSLSWCRAGAGGLAALLGSWARSSNRSSLIWPCLHGCWNSAEASRGETGKSGKELWASPALAKNLRDHFRAPRQGLA